MKRTNTILAAAAVAGFATVGVLADDPTVESVIEQSREALKEVEALSYDFTFTGSGFLADRVPTIKGVVKLKDGASADQSMMLVKGVFTPPADAQAEEVELTYASDGVHTYAIDPSSKMFLHGKIGEGGEMLLGANQMLVLDPYLAENPYAEEEGAPSMKLDGVETVGDVQCDVLFVDYGQAGQARWFIAKSDHLPRGVERLMAMGEMNGSTTLKATNIKTGVELEDSIFKLTAPEGYETEEMTAPQRPELLSEGSVAPSWSLETPDGKSVSLESLRGEVVVLDFWATWCGPCKRAMPGMQALHEKFEDQPVKIIGVNVWDDEGDPVGYMEENEFSYMLLLKGDSVAEAYGVSGIPTFYVIGPDGKIVHREVGFNPDGEAELASIIEKALPKKADG
ncbi:MAG: TlpA family protein disulfide reductase [Phycisphaerales bacterium]